VLISKWSQQLLQNFGTVPIHTNLNEECPGLSVMTTSSLFIYSTYCIIFILEASQNDAYLNTHKMQLHYGM
jgi:hypothetical protein